MNKARKLLATAVVVGLVGTVGGWATYAAFSSTTESAGNRFAAGTVALGSNSSGSWMYQVDNAEPLDTVTKCTKVTYTGTLPAAVKLYVSPIGTGGDYVNLTITPGTGDPTFPGCDGFVADGAPIFSDTLTAFEAHSNFANGLADNPGSAANWVANDSVVYQFELELLDDPAANGGATPLTTGNHTFTWEANNV